jgi:hypothetical protein
MYLILITDMGLASFYILFISFYTVPSKMASRFCYIYRVLVYLDTDFLLVQHTEEEKAQSHMYSTECDLNDRKFFLHIYTCTPVLSNVT